MENKKTTGTYIIFKSKIFFINVHLLIFFNIFDKIQRVNFPTVNKISKFHENRRQKSSAGVGGLNCNFSAKTFF